MQEPGRGPFAGVDLRRPKGYPAASTAPATAAEDEVQGDRCPRCESRDTKFCYYNNYNTSQPRHYCRSCRRYWTKGGSLRNVPVGGGSRKTSSPSSSSSSSAASPRRAKNSKRRRVAPPEPEPSITDAAGAAQTLATANGIVGDPVTAVDAARMEATADGAMDDPGAPPAVDGEGFADPSVALGFGVAGADGKDPFEWPAGCDLGYYWAPGVFADADLALFLNLP